MLKAQDSRLKHRRTCMTQRLLPTANGSGVAVRGRAVPAQGEGGRVTVGWYLKCTGGSGVDLIERVHRLEPGNVMLNS